MGEFQKYVIEVRDRHIPLMRIGVRKLKSDQGKDKKTSRMACIPFHIKMSRASSFIQLGEEDNPYSEEAA